MRPQVPPYVRRSRTSDDHYLWKKDAKKPWHWKEAWEWLYTNAAWRPDGKRLSRGVADLKRGQLAVTIRGLGARWNWSTGAVRYFLKRLCEDGMIETAVANTKISTSFGPRESYRATLITVCNYEKFQGALCGKFGGSTQGLAQGQSDRWPELPGIIAESSPLTEQTRGPYKESPARLEKPRHLATSRDSRWVWCDYGSDDWRTYQADYRSVRGTDILPENRIGGRGNWFFKAGEGLRPKRKQRRA